MRVVIDVPIRLESELNRSEHWTKKAARRKSQRQAVLLCWRSQVRSVLPAAAMFHVELVRLCPPKNKIRDTDNLAAAFKSIRDEVANQLGVDDADIAQGDVTWDYAQDSDDRHWVRITVHVRQRGAIA